MPRRIALWALVGFSVAAGWAVYSMVVPLTIASGEWRFIEITCPPAALGRAMPLKLYWVLLLNALTYAAAGLLFESLVRASRAFSTRVP